MPGVASSNLPVPTTAVLITFVDVHRRRRTSHHFIKTDPLSCQLSCSPLLEKHEKRGTLVVFSANNLTKDVILPAEMWATRPKRNEDTRTPEELLDFIEAKGKEVAEALASLRAMSAWK